MSSNPSGLANPVRAERSFVGAIIMGDAAVESSGVSDLDLCDPFCQRVYLACEELAKAGHQPDLATLCDQYPSFSIQAVNQLMQEAALERSLITQHIRSILDASSRRKFADICRSGGELALRSAKPLSETVFAVQQAMDKVCAAVADGLAVNGTDALVELDGWLSRTEEEALFPTGIPALDDTLCGGLRQGRLTVIGARPSVGKSALLAQIALQALTEGRRVLYVSLEMGEREIMLRMVAHHSGVPCNRLEGRDLTEDELIRVAEAYGKAMPGNLFIATSAVTPAAIRQEAVRLRHSGGLDLICVDYLQLMQAGRNTSNRAEAVGSISRALKQLAMELRCPVVAASQVNRSSTYGEERAPRLSELRESGSIEQDADAVLLLHCPERSRSLSIKTLELAVAKNRQGALANLSVLFDAPRMRFCDAQAAGCPPPS